MAKRSRAVAEASPKVRSALTKLGNDLQSARQGRNLSFRMLAERTGVSVPTLMRLEDGDPAVSVGILATVLAAFGKLRDLMVVADESQERAERGFDSEEPRPVKRRWRVRKKNWDD